MTGPWYEAYLEARRARGLSDTDDETRRTVGRRHFDGDPRTTPEDAAHHDDTVRFAPLSEEPA